MEFYEYYQKNFNIRGFFKNLYDFLLSHFIYILSVNLNCQRLSLPSQYSLFMFCKLYSKIDVNVFFFFFVNTYYELLFRMQRLKTKLNKRAQVYGRNDQNTALCPSDNIGGNNELFTTNSLEKYLTRMRKMETNK